MSERRIVYLRRTNRSIEFEQADRVFPFSTMKRGRRGIHFGAALGRCDRWWRFGAILLIGWIRSGQTEALYAALAIGVATAILFGVGWSIETENEGLRRMLFKTADDLENNRYEAVLATFYDRPEEAVIAARSMLESKKYLFTAARIKKIHSIEFAGPNEARRAVVRMNVFVEGTFHSYQAAVPRYVELSLFRVGKEWKVVNFTHQDAFEGFKVKEAMALP